jgi:hypothetical protein
MLGMTEDYEIFDPDIIMHINSVFSILAQLGVGPASGFLITDKTQQWSEFIPKTAKNLELVKSYVFMKVKLLFDPPATSFGIDALNKSISEFEWRLNVASENTNQGGEIQNGN